MTTPLSIAARVVAEFREKLKAAHDLEDGDPFLEDSLEGISDLPELLARAARQAKRDEAFSEAIGAIIKENAARVARLESRAQRIRLAITQAMSEAGMKKLPLPDMSISLGEGKPHVETPDPSAVPIEFCRLRTEPNKTIIREWLEGGNKVNWAHLSEPKPVLRITTK